MNKIYLDNASTTYPKPQAVADAMYDYIRNSGCTINRGCYSGAYAVEDMVFDTRQRLTKMFGGTSCKNLVFTKNITESLNTILKGLLKPGDHVIVSTMEHNAIMRPLTQLRQLGVEFSRVKCDPDGSIPENEVVSRLSACLLPNTRAVIMTHASNVCGTIMPIRLIGEFCRDNGLFFIVDSAQTAGILPINMKECNISALCFTGHKGLLGPQGIGGFLLQEGLSSKIEPLISGGTGSISHTEDIPDFMPDRFEAGTPNLPGIFGMNASLKWLEDTGIANIHEHEMQLTEAFIHGLKLIPGIRILGKQTINERLGVVSIDIPSRDISQIAYRLDEEYGIMTRVGLHCAPNAHITLNTYPTGTIRFSFGFFNTLNDVDAALSALQKLI